MPPFTRDREQAEGHWRLAGFDRVCQEREGDPEVSDPAFTNDLMVPSEQPGQVAPGKQTGEAQQRAQVPSLELSVGSLVCSAPGHRGSSQAPYRP